MGWINREKSFVAEVKCQTPHFEGHWDCAEILLDGPGQERRKSVEWLTVTNYAEGERHLFQFDCFYDEKGYAGYDIRSYTYGQGRRFNSIGQRFGFSSGGYIALYPLKPTPEMLWQPYIFADGQPQPILEVLKNGRLDNVRIETRHGRTLKPYKRYDAHRSWYCYVNDESGPAMELTLHIQQLGKEHNDDH